MFMTDSKPKPVDTIVPIADLGDLRQSPEKIRDLFRHGKYPYQTKIKKAAYEAHKEELLVELLA